MSQPTHCVATTFLRRSLADIDRISEAECLVGITRADLRASEELCTKLSSELALCQQELELTQGLLLRAEATIASTEANVQKDKEQSVDSSAALEAATRELTRQPPPHCHPYSPITDSCSFICSDVHSLK